MRAAVKEQDVICQRCVCSMAQSKDVAAFGSTAAVGWKQCGTTHWRQQHSQQQQQQQQQRQEQQRRQ